jgi:hypothetical protein
MTRSVEAGAVLAAVLAALAVIALAAICGPSALTSWISAVVLMSALPTGAITLLLIGVLVPGAWAERLRSPLTRLARTGPLVLLLILPVLLDLPATYRWVGELQATAFRTAWLSPVAFSLRAIAWAFFLACAGWRTSRPVGPGLACLGLTVITLGSTVIATDWLQSLDPEFNSSGFGLYVLSQQVLLSFSVALVVTMTGDRSPAPYLGGLLLTLLLLWAYFGFMQYVIIWSDNLPPEVRWYQHRSGMLWGAIIYAVGLVRGVALALLLFRRFRGDPMLLRLLAGAVASTAPLEVAWIALPQARETAPAAILQYSVASAALVVAIVWLLRLSFQPSPERAA